MTAAPFVETHAIGEAREPDEHLVALTNRQAGEGVHTEFGDEGLW